MTVRVKAAALVVLSFLIAFVAIHFISQNVLVPSYASLETRQVQTSVVQALQAMGARLNSLEDTDHDWASWDDTYDYVLTKSSKYISANLVDETFISVSVNAMVIIDASGDVVFAKAYDFENDESMDTPPDLLTHLTPDSYLGTRFAAGEAAGGILNLAEGVMLVSARPILTSAESGPPRGTFVMGTFVSERMMQEISDVTSLSVSVSPMGESIVKPTGTDAPPFTTSMEVAVTPLGPDSIEGTSIIDDFYGQPVLAVSLTQSRDIYAEGQRTLTFLFTIIAIGGAALSVLFLFALDRTILSRMSRLAARVRAVGEQPDFSGKVAIDGDDDIGFLARTINETLEALARTHRQLEDSHTKLERANADLEHAKQELGTTANQLRRLTRHVQSMREDEQAFVAREIRDEVGQGLTAMKMDLATLQRTYARGDVPAVGFLQGMTGVVDSLLETVRRLSTGLRPSTLEDLGLADGFEWQLAEFGRERAIKTSLVVQGPTGDVEDSRALTLFRILQEALLVCAEDPSTSEVSVSLAIENGYALLALKDNGTTVLTGEALSRREIGLSLIRERTEIFGGGLSIDSSSESGTSIVAQLPL